MRIKRKALLMFCGVCLGASATFAQQAKMLQSVKAPAPVSTSVDSQPHINPALNGFVKETEYRFTHGLYGDVIVRSSQQIAGTQSPDARLLYLRGVAAWQVSIFPLAEKDLARIGDFRPHDNWASAADYLAKVRKIKAVVPPNMSEVRIGNQVAFRVFYSHKTEYTDAIQKLLPLAYNINRQFIKKRVTPTQVFIFRNPDHFKAFYNLRTNGRSPGSWQWAMGDVGTMSFCPAVPGANDNARKVNSDYFQSTIVHEFNHTLVNAISGSADMPMWLREGLAMVVQSRSSSENAASIKRRMQQALAQKQFLPLTEISTQKDFVQNTENFVSKNRQSSDGADTYPQACFMANYFLSLLPPGGLEAFLTDLGNQRQFDVVFQKYTQDTLPDFYHAWLQQLPQQFT